MLTPSLQFLVATMAGWVNRSQQDVIDYLQAENRILRERLGDRRLRFTDAFKATVKFGGVETVKLPVRSPNLNAHAERFVRSIKSDCLSKIIPLGERHLRLAVAEFSDHYHMERNHQGLDNRLIRLPRGQPRNVGRVRRSELSVLLKIRIFITPFESIV